MISTAPCSTGRHPRGHRVTFTGDRFTCDCHGFTTWSKRKENFDCRHIRFVEDRVSSQLLSVEGTPSAGMIAQAIDDISADYFLLRTHWIYDHHRRARYGYVPRYGPDWKARIGLHASARRELSAAEKAALVGTLRRKLDSLVVESTAA